MQVQEVIPGSADDKESNAEVSAKGEAPILDLEPKEIIASPDHLIQEEPMAICRRTADRLAATELALMKDAKRNYFMEEYGEFLDESPSRNPEQLSARIEALKEKLQ